MDEIPTRLKYVAHMCQAIHTRKWMFTAFSVVIFLITTIVLAHVGIIPDAHSKPLPRIHTASAITLSSMAPVRSNILAISSRFENPIKVVIPSVHVSASIKNPNTMSARILDKALLSGAVRYPRSAMLGERGNVILFGHSSYLPIVINQAYKTFNGIQGLHQGARVLVYSSSKIYEYAVSSVKKENATVDSITLTVRGKVLTLATCNVFGKRSSRFIVTARFVKSYPIGNNS